MKIGLDLNKRDLLTIIVVSIVFFSLAVWNLGLTRAPVTTWQTTETNTVQIDLGAPADVGAVYFLVKDGAVSVQVYTGSSVNWSSSGNFILSSRRLSIVLFFSEFSISGKIKA